MERLEQKPFDLSAAQPTPHCFIQWKGTDVCMDLHCECGQHIHIDAEFAYAVQCVKCETIWEMPSHIYPRRVKEWNGCIVKTEIDENGEGWAVRG